MADGEKRIVELTETQTFGNGDYLPLDNISNSETKKIEAKKLGITYTMTDTEDGFSFDGSNGYHYEKVIPKDAQMSYEDYEDLTEAEKMDGSNRFIPDYPDEVKEPEIWTRVGRTPLETDAKTISPAINELKGRIDDSDDEITEIKSNLAEKSNLIDVVEYNRSATFNLDANQTTYVTWDIARTGYTPLGIVGLLGSGTSALAFQDNYIDGTTAYFYMRNVSGSRATGISNLRVRILYVKNS